jgi:hypothetical protein
VRQFARLKLSELALVQSRGRFSELECKLRRKNGTSWRPKVWSPLKIAANGFTGKAVGERTSDRIWPN